MATPAGHKTAAAGWGEAASEPDTAATARRITSATACGWEMKETCEPSISVMIMPARCAMDLTTSLPAALSHVATAAQHGRELHAGGPVGSVKPKNETGRGVAAISAASSAERSAAKASWNLAGSMANS